MRPSPTEEQALTSAGIVDPLMQGYMAWRRSLLFVAVPFALLSGALAVWDLATKVDTEGLTALGAVATVVPSLAVLVLVVATVVAAVTWRNQRMSTRTLQTAWAISLLAPVLIAMVPVQWLLTEAGMNQFGPDTELFTRIAISINYSIALLPSLLSFPSGVVRGAARIKSLLPASTLAGWVLVVMAPLYAVFFIVAMIIVEQLAGNALLMIGILLLAVSPFVHVFAARLYVLPLTDAAEVRRLDTVQRRAGIVTVVGGLMLVIWALTARFGDAPLIGSAPEALLDHKTALLRVFELVFRVLVTTAVFSHLVLQITETSWRFDRGFSDPQAFRRHEEQMAQVERTLRSTGDQVD